MARSLSLIAPLLLAGSALAQGAQIPLPAYSNTYSSASGTRGFWFQAPIPFLITGLRVPDEQMDGTQNVEVYIMSAPPPPYSQIATGGQVFYAANVPSAQVVPTSIAVQPGDYVGVLGACGTTTMYNSYGAGSFPSDVLGTPITLERFITQTNLNTSGGNQPYSAASGSIARVEVYAAPLSGVFASFSADRTFVAPGEIVTFTDLSFSSDPAGVLGWQWDLDGDSNIDATVQNPTFAYPSCGMYDVSLTAIDANGSHTSTRTAYIDATALPQAGFSVLAGPAPVLAHFTDTSTFFPVSWAWDFDNDGATDSTLQSPSWSFATQGLHPVTLTVTNLCGSDSITQLVDTRSVLCTDFTSDSTLAQGGGIFFDLLVNNAQGVTLESIDLNSSAPAGQVVAIDVYVRLNGSHVGNTGSQAGWTLASGGRRAFSAGPDQATTIGLHDICLPPGSHAIQVFYSAGGARYVTGDGGTGPGSNTYWSNTDLALQAGASRSGRFVGTETTGVVWSGCLAYDISARGSIAQIGIGCAGSSGATPSLSTRGGEVPVIGQTITFDVASAPPSTALSFVMVGFVPTGGIDLAVIGMPSCRLQLDPLANLDSPTDQAGNASASLGITNLPTTVGLVFYVQGFIADPGANAFGAILSDAISGTVGSCP